MKKIIAFLLAFALGFMLLSCGAARKVERKTDDSRLYGLNVGNEANERNDRFVDTTRSENQKITITEIEFFEPAVLNGANDGEKYSDAFNRLDSAIREDNKRKGKYADAFKRADSAFWASYGNNDGGVVVNPSGIKSIKQKVIESQVEKRGVSVETQESNETSNAAIVDAGETNVQEAQEPTKDPYRWRYIFMIVLIVAVLAVGGWLCFKRFPILKWLRAIF